MDFITSKREKKLIAENGYLYTWGFPPASLGGGARAPQIFER